MTGKQFWETKCHVFIIKSIFTIESDLNFEYEAEFDLFDLNFEHEAELGFCELPCTHAIVF